MSSVYAAERDALGAASRDGPEVRCLLWFAVVAEGRRRARQQMDLLRDLEVLALDCQAGGATPEHGDLLELGWVRCTATGLLAPATSHWIAPRSKRPIPRAVRELTGWAESCLAEAIEETSAWSALLAEVSNHWQAGIAPTVIHFARFELSFLRDLHQRLDTARAFPFDVICLHAVAARLLPHLPRRNIRALAGYFGHSAELLRRSAGHVEATASIWRALVPLLEQRGVASWSELKTWLERTSLAPRSSKRSFPLPAERRRALPDRAGVYRFLRSNGDVLYVGKATSLKKRVASHFKSRGPSTERALELLTQVHEVLHSETASLLEAALLETDEIKRLEPPYNVQLRSLNRSAWFASRDFGEAVPFCDPAHPVGPLPSERALSGLAALSALAEGAPPTPSRCAQALAVPAAFLPDLALFQAGFSAFFQERLQLQGAMGLRRILHAALALWLERGRNEPEVEAVEDAAPDTWDLARVRRRLERNLVQGGLLYRRSRCLCLLSDSTVGFREPGAARARALVFSAGLVAERHELLEPADIAALPVQSLRPRAARGLSFDAATYDRLRVLLTEFHRLREGGGELSLRFGKHTLAGPALMGLLRSV